MKPAFDAAGRTVKLNLWHSTPKASKCAAAPSRLATIRPAITLARLFNAPLDFPRRAAPKRAGPRDPCGETLRKLKADTGRVSSTHAPLDCKDFALAIVIGTPAACRSIAQAWYEFVSVQARLSRL